MSGDATADGESDAYRRPSPSLTAFVSHSDCARHDTGWSHPDHQGRLPALVRAVYKDMLTLHGHLLDLEAAPATEAQLRLVHTAEYVAYVRAMADRAAAAGESLALPAGPIVSGASFDAALAAAGCALTGVDAVMRGEARNAFCSARPAGAGSGADVAGGHSLFNNVAIAARWARGEHGAGRVLVVEWGGALPSRLAEVLAADEGVWILSLRPASGGMTEAIARAKFVGLPAGATGEAFAAAFGAALQHAAGAARPDLVLLAAGFDALAGDPLSDLALQPADYHGVTRALIRVADQYCDGRLVSVLEGGYDPAGTGRAVVQHIRALSGLPPAA
jgi:acetoin utilization deacetylase AcuC-like enzyme